MITWCSPAVGCAGRKKGRCDQLDGLQRLLGPGARLVVHAAIDRTHETYCVTHQQTSAAWQCSTVPQSDAQLIEFAQQRAPS